MHLNIENKGIKMKKEKQFKRGFTLVEVVFGSVVALMMFGVFWQIYYSQTSTAYKLTKKNDALRSAQLAAEVIQKDFKQLVSVEIERNGDGTINRKYGDHTAPALVSPSGKSVSFYIPAKTAGSQASTSEYEACYTATYAMVPSKQSGIYEIKRSILTSTEEVSNVKDGVAAELPGKSIQSVQVKDVTFHLLDPKAPSTMYRSPDTNYYLQATILGTDSTGAETMTANVLVCLEYPSVMQMTQNIQEITKYKPIVPLVTTPDTFTATPEEQATISKIENITKQFADGSLSATAYENQMTALINKHAGQTNGPVIGSTGNIIPHISKLTVSGPVAIDQPVVLSSPSGQKVIVPPPSQVKGSPSSPNVTVGEAPDDGHFSFSVTVLDSNGNPKFHQAGQGDGNYSSDEMKNMINTGINNGTANAYDWIKNNSSGNGNVGN